MKDFTLKLGVIIPEYVSMTDEIVKVLSYDTEDSCLITSDKDAFISIDYAITNASTKEAYEEIGRAHV